MEGRKKEARESKEESDKIRMKERKKSNILSTS